MPEGWPRAAPRGRHALDSGSNRRRRLTLLTAPLVTVLVVGTGVATTGFNRPEAPGANSARATPAASAPTASESATSQDRILGTSRSTARVPLVNNRVPQPKGRLWTTEDLDLRIEPRGKSRVAGLLRAGKQIAITGRRQGGFAEVIVNQVPRWVTADHLSRKKTPEVMGLSNQPCADGSSIESSLQPAAVKVYRAACAAFPELSSYGGQDGHGEHVNGEAIDFMVTSSSVGQRLADFLYANKAELDLFDIIWSQRIWTIERSGEGFRSMSDRGSSTANHYDHVHIKVN